MTNQNIQQIVTFRIEDELFGLPVMNVREIIFPSDIKPITTESNHVVGVVVLRGQVISILDLRVLLHKEPKTENKKQRIIILSHHEHMVGLLVDEVSQVMSVKNMDFDNPPKSSSPYIFAICKEVQKNTIIYMIETEKLHDVEGDAHAN